MQEGLEFLKPGCCLCFVCKCFHISLFFFCACSPLAELSLQLSLDRAFSKERNAELFNTYDYYLLLNPMIYQDRWIEIIRRYVVSVHSCRATLALSTWFFWMPSIPICSCSCVAMWLGLCRWTWRCAWLVLVLVVGNSDCWLFTDRISEYTTIPLTSELLFTSTYHLLLLGSHTSGTILSANTSIKY